MSFPRTLDLFCRVVDNFGDIGFAWRLACDLAGRGESVRLAVDDASALAWMAPRGAGGVEVVGWSDQAPVVADVVVELFGGGRPASAVRSESAVTKGLPSRSPPIQLPGRRKFGTRAPNARSQRW